jgi:hypothetical protein
MKKDGSVLRMSWWADFRAASNESSSIDPAWSALAGQILMQAGFSPFSNRSKQKLHFCILPFLPNCGTPNGQTIKHILHPIQKFGSTKTKPSFLRL